MALGTAEPDWGQEATGGTVALKETPPVSGWGPPPSTGGLGRAVGWEGPHRGSVEPPGDRRGPGGLWSSEGPHRGPAGLGDTTTPPPGISGGQGRAAGLGDPHRDAAGFQGERGWDPLGAGGDLGGLWGSKGPHRDAVGPHGDTGGDLQLPHLCSPPAGPSPPEGHPSGSARLLPRLRRVQCPPGGSRCGDGGSRVPHPRLALPQSCILLCAPVCPSPPPPPASD